MVLLRISLFFLILLLLPDWYIYRFYIRQSAKKWKRRLWWVPTIGLLLALLVFLAAFHSLQHAFSIYLIIALCIAVPKMVFMICDTFLYLCKKLVQSIFKLSVSLPVARLYTLFKVCLPLLASLATCAYIVFGAIFGKEYFQVKEVTFTSADLPPAFDGYRILQLSDMHTGSWTDQGNALQRAVSLCNAQHPDLIVFTGDLVNSRADELKPFMPILSQLRATDGIYSVLGNHDYGTYVHWNTEAERLANIDTLISREKQMGWDMLMNEHRILHRGNDSIAIIGVENSGNPPFPDRGNLPKAQKGTENMFKVLLSHDPTHWRREVLPRTDIQLMLAGHTHDMQVNLFGFSFSKFVYPEHRGMYLKAGRGLYVNIGLGYVMFPMRLGAWPEITVITLKTKN